MPSSAVQTCARSEEHTSELQSLTNLVCRLLLEKKNNNCAIIVGARPNFIKLAPFIKKAKNYPEFKFKIIFFNDTATTEIYTLSLHDALPISKFWHSVLTPHVGLNLPHLLCSSRSEEHTSELQSRSDLVCRLLLEKKAEAIRDKVRMLKSHINKMKEGGFIALSIDDGISSIERKHKQRRIGMQKAKRYNKR